MGQGSMASQSAGWGRQPAAVVLMADILNRPYRKCNISRPQNHRVFGMCGRVLPYSISAPNLFVADTPTYGVRTSLHNAPCRNLETAGSLSETIGSRRI